MANQQATQPPTHKTNGKNGASVVKVPERAVRVLGGETFADLAFKPSSVRFEHQNDDEETLMLVREHIAIFWWNGMMTILGVLLPFFLLFVQNYLTKKGFLPFTIDAKWWWAGIILWYLFLFSSIFKRFIDWFYNVNIMTNQRFIDLDFYTFTGHKVKETPLIKIQDASDSHVGPWQMVFDMGNLTVYTASERTTFNLHNVPASSQVRDFIMDTVIAYTDEFKFDDIVSAP